MNDTDFKKYVRESLTRIEDHLEKLNGRLLDHATKIAALTAKQNGLLAGEQNRKIFWVRFAAAFFAGAAVSLISFLVGKKF